MGNTGSKKIKSAAKKEKTTLSLHSEGIKKLSDKIGRCVLLQELMLDGNKLKELPPQMGELKALKRLNLFSNKLKALPDEITQCCAIEDLNCSTNKVSFLFCFCFFVLFFLSFKHPTRHTLFFGGKRMGIG